MFYKTNTHRKTGIDYLQCPFISPFTLCLRRAVLFSLIRGNRSPLDLERVEPHHGQHDRALCDVLVIGVKSGQLHAVREKSHDQDTGDTVRNLAVAAADGYTADQNAGQDRDLGACRGTSRSRADTGCQDNGTDTAEQTCHTADRVFHALYIDTGQSRCRLIAAECKHIASEIGAVHDEAHDNTENDHRDGRVSQARMENCSLADRLKAVRQVGDRLGIGDNVGNALIYGTETDGYENTRQLQQLFEQGAERAERHADSDGDDHDYRNRQSGVGQHQRRQDTADTHLVSDRHIQAAGHHDQRDTVGADDDVRVLVQDVQQVLHGQKVVARECKYNTDDQ